MMEDAAAPVYDRGGRGSSGRIDNLGIPATAASTGLVGFGVQFHGWSFRETAGAAASCRVRDGRDATGAILATIGLAANASDHEWLGDAGVTADVGLYLEVVSGSVEGAVYFAAPQLQRRE